MKTYKNLYPQIYSFPNLYAAFRKARKGKRNRPAVASFEFDLEHNLLAPIALAGPQSGGFRRRMFHGSDDFTHHASRFTQHIQEAQCQNPNP